MRGIDGHWDCKADVVALTLRVRAFHGYRKNEYSRNPATYLASGFLAADSGEVVQGVEEGSSLDSRVSVVPAGAAAVVEHIDLAVSDT